MQSLISFTNLMNKCQVLCWLVKSAEQIKIEPLVLQGVHGVVREMDTTYKIKIMYLYINTLLKMSCGKTKVGSSNSTWSC